MAGSMNLRRRCLPAGWYPPDEKATRRAIESFQRSITVEPRVLSAGVVPHAGWEFSGSIALRVLMSQAGPVDTCVVVGGHLPPGGGLYMAEEEAYETPFGSLAADRELARYLADKLSVREDRSPDNTVEIQLPFIKFLFPESRALWLRASPSSEALALGRILFAAAGDLGKKLFVIGSTDLTHYGENYGFSPKGRGEPALRWVKEVNDKKVIDHLLGLELPEALATAAADSSACSIGGAVTAAQFAALAGSRRGVLAAYATSHDVYPHESFVGYAGITYPA
jgi:MEMO1 family protein